MSATAIALKILEERGQLQQPYGQRAFAILLFQDMSVVPLLALLPLLAPGADSHVAEFGDTLIAVGRIVLCIGIVVVAGRYLLNPFLALARQHRRPRGDDGGRPAGRARRRRPDAIRGHVDGARRVPRRRDARGIELPP